MYKVRNNQELIRICFYSVCGLRGTEEIYEEIAKTWFYACVDDQGASVRRVGQGLKTFKGELKTKRSSGIKSVHKTFIVYVKKNSFVMVLNHLLCTLRKFFNAHCR